LPIDFQAAPHFHFAGPVIKVDLEENASVSGIDDLSQAMTPVEGEGTGTPRSQRRRSKPQVYQSESEEMREKNMEKKT